MRIRRFFFLVVMVFVCWSLQGQPSDSTEFVQAIQTISSNKIEWTVTKLRDLTAGVESPIECSFVTNGTMGVDWIQGNGTVVYTFSVKESQLGEFNGSDQIITYHVDLNQWLGEIQIQKRGQEFWIVVDIRDNSGGAIKNEYYVSSYEIQ